jgi:hypothetical protein
MIIFGLDGTLADCEHRRHFVDPEKDPNTFEYEPGRFYYNDIQDESHSMEKWRPDWKSFYEACDMDEPIYPTIKIFERFDGTIGWDHGLKIWSGRCESTRNKTIEWLRININAWPEYSEDEIISDILKMRPIGDNTPDNELKERWLDEAIAEGKTIDFVFESDPRSIQMWRSRGIFVFDCNQTGNEF